MRRRFSAVFIQGAIIRIYLYVPEVRQYYGLVLLCFQPSRYAELLLSASGVAKVGQGGATAPSNRKKKPFSEKG
jgi:hypothetical protein